MPINYGLLNTGAPAQIAGSFMQGYQQSQDRANMLAQQERQNKLAEMQMKAATRAEQLAEAKRAAYNAAQTPADIPGALRAQGLGEEAFGVEAQMATQQAAQRKAQLEQVKTLADLYKRTATSVFADPANAKAHVVRFGQQTGSDVTEELRQIDAMGNDPAKIKAWAAGHAMDADKLLPKFETSNLGATIERTGYDPMTGQPIGPAVSRPVTMTPYQIEQNKIAKGQLTVSQGHLKVAQDRLKEEGIKLSAEDDNLLATAIAEGRVDVNKVNGRNAKYLVGALKAQPGIDLREMSIENIASGAGARALGVQSAKMQTAAIEADKMIDIVRNTSAAIDRTQFPTINAIQNAVDKGTGGREIVQLNTAINSLVNSYARAISPTGQPTVSDKNHAREVINSAYSNGQIDAITDIMRQEMAIAKASPKEAQEAAREMRKGETKTPSVSPQDKQALDWANANPGDPRAAKIKATLGVK